MAIGLAVATISMKTVGSITCPAAKSNVGIKPTTKLVTKDNVIVARLRGAVGLITSSIKDFEGTEDAPSYNSPEVLAAFEKIIYLGGEVGINRALAATNVDALVLSSLICSDIPGLIGHPTINVPIGLTPPDTPVKRNFKGDLTDEAPNVP
ncbi:hypothetical protein GQ44DRAFT_797151 [Phaeosphaeriaceae sp. PMI808]|nr:hypothetical protein GQ44DRAFT_797151 [Phaeosphaeriaceae sp. PMI808]